MKIKEPHCAALSAYFSVSHPINGNNDLSLLMCLLLIWQTAVPEPLVHLKMTRGNELESPLD